MALAPGTRLGVYEVTTQIGEGGMGQVWRARDTQLNRDVALKVLPDSFANDPDRLARFTREAQTLAALNHPNIAAIYGIEAHALVMELVEGEDLSQRIARGAIPLEETLPIARQIADALEAAHEQGIIHRDLKPANIKVRDDGTVKVLDFGLARAMDPAGESSAGAMNSPTLTARATQMGMILGTAAYMSPEQARGKPLDKRTDIWSFGCVFYEMLTGQRPFPGDEFSDAMASILAREPDWRALPGATPTSVRRLLERCLEKDRTQRLRDIGDARIEMRDAPVRSDSASATGLSRRSRSLRERLAWIAVVALALALIASLLFRPGSVKSTPEVRFEVVTPPSAAPLSVAISPDGRWLTYVAPSGDDSVLWLRALETGASSPAPRTEGAQAPFWKPDSKSVGFFADGKLKSLEISTGSVQIVANAPSGTGGTWSRENIILFASLGRPISRVSATTAGDPVSLAGLAQIGSDYSPSFLPDGRHFLYYVRGNPEVRGVYAGQLDQQIAPRRLFDADTGAVYAPSGHLLYILRGTLFAQVFDPVRLEGSGDPFVVAAQIADRSEGAGPRASSYSVSVSNSGAIAYRASFNAGQRQLIWFDRGGNKLGSVGEPLSTSLSQPSLSPDGTRVAFYRPTNGNVDVWLMDVKRGTPTPLTSDAADEVYPVWAPDANRVAFSSNRTGVHQIYVKSTTGSDPGPPIVSTPLTKFATDWSRDGKLLLFDSYDPKTGFDIWAVPVDGDRTPFAVVQTARDDERAQFSPDGRWIAFQSNESGQAEIWVQRFPDAGRSKGRVSINGGTEVRWGKDSRELFYVARNGQLMVVSMGLEGDTPEIGKPVPLFTPPLGSARQVGDARHQYMVSRDGQRVLVAAVSAEQTGPISLILNWRAQR